MRRAIALVLLLLVVPHAAAAQRGTRSGADAFVIEAAGATAGSLAGALATHRILEETRGPCDVEDLACLLGRVGVIGIGSAVGAAWSGYALGHATDTDPSGLGSALGAVVGVAVGAAAVKGLEEMDVRSQWVAAIGYTFVHGIVTAAGSRLLAGR